MDWSKTRHSISANSRNQSYRTKISNYLSSKEINNQERNNVQYRFTRIESNQNSSNTCNFFQRVIVCRSTLPSYRSPVSYSSRQRRLRRRGRRKARVAQERRFQSKKGRSAPHIPPVVSAGLGATEPLRGSTIRRASGSQLTDPLHLPSPPYFFPGSRWTC